jgi:cystathionine beta-lyase/cystathionine gamma-synthase
MDISYILNQLGEDRHEYFNAISPPIMQTSNFAFDTVDDLRKAFEDEMGGYLYSRGLNPTVDILRKKLAALDGAEDSLVFNNGAAATFAGVLANVRSGDHIVSVDHPYSWTRHLFDQVLPRFGVTTTYIDGRHIENFERAILPHTSLIYLESPTSWYFELQDLKAVAELAKAEGIVTIIDNSYCSPLYQRPIEMGIDISMQTATKYIGGHSDTLGGVLSGSSEMIRKIFLSEYMCIGSGIQPFNAWLLLRGLRTLPARLERINRTTEKVWQFLKTHPVVETLIYPFDPDFDQFALAKNQMEQAPGLISIYVNMFSAEDIERFCDGLKHFKMAVSWGGHESLVIPKLSTMAREAFDPNNKDHRMIRIYVGLEEADYLISDLAQGLGQ